MRVTRIWSGCGPLRGVLSLSSNQPFAFGSGSGSRSAFSCVSSSGVWRSDPWTTNRVSGGRRKKLDETMMMMGWNRGGSGAITTTTTATAITGGRSVHRHARFSSSTTSESESSSDDDTTELGSSRGRAAVSLLPVYLTDARSVSQYDPVDAPDGALQLSVAENQLLQDLLLPAVRRFSRSLPSSSDNNNDDDDDDDNGTLFQSDQIYYQTTHGRPALREAVATYLQKLLRIPNTHTLDIEGLVCGAGCNAVLENLCFCLAGHGDAVLIPTPYYAAFEFDLKARAGLKVVPVPTLSHTLTQQKQQQQQQTSSSTPQQQRSIPKEAYYPTKESLDQAYEQAKITTGSPPKILLLSHPNNPLGISYPPSVIDECISWARTNHVHLVSDEIYAGSVYKSDSDFQSALLRAVTNNNNNNNNNNDDDDETNTDAAPGGLGLGPYVHFVYALSKDLALSGLRVGVSYSENPHIRLPMQKLNDLCQISSQTQSLVQRMLSAPVDGTTTTTTTATTKEDNNNNNNRLWSVDTFLPQNQDRIRQRCDRLQRCLTKLNVPHLNADAGMFVWIDLTEFLPPLALQDTTTQPAVVLDLDETEESKDQRERQLYLELLNEYGLLLTPGRSMRNELPGFFRCVFTAASDSEFDLGLERIEKFVEAKRS